MNTYLMPLFIEALTSVFVSLTVLYVLSRPLLNVLSRICPDEQAAAFWLIYAKVMLIIAPLLLVLTVDLFMHFSEAMDALRLALIVALGGILIGLHLIGRRLGQFMLVPKQPGSTS